MVQTIYNMGDDALNNQCNVIIQSLPGWDQTEALQLRASSYPIKGYHVLNYEVKYKGYTVNRGKAGSDEERTLEIKFRADRYWKIYKMLRNWGKSIYDHENKDVGTGDIEGQRINIITEHDGGITCTYRGCLYENIDDIELDQTSEGEPIEVTLKVIYLESIVK